jgi:hypothetical protein
VQAIYNALRIGNTRRNAAAFAEIDSATFYRWLEDDAAFRSGVIKAEADAEARFLGQIAKAASDGTWTAAAWWLERRRHEDYRKREGVEVSGPDGGPIETRATASISDHERDLLQAAILGELASREESEA